MFQQRCAYSLAGFRSLPRPGDSTPPNTKVRTVHPPKRVKRETRVSSRTPHGRQGRSRAPRKTLLLPDGSAGCHAAAAGTASAPPQHGAAGTEPTGRLGLPSRAPPRSQASAPGALGSHLCRPGCPAIGESPPRVLAGGKDRLVAGRGRQKRGRERGGGSGQADMAGCLTGSPAQDQQWAESGEGTGSRPGRTDPGPEGEELALPFPVRGPAGLLSGPNSVFQALEQAVSSWKLPGKLPGATERLAVFSFFLFTILHLCLNSKTYSWQLIKQQPKKQAAFPTFCSDP